MRPTLWPTNTVTCIASGQRHLFEDRRTILKYARFDGTTWTDPNDIYITCRGIENMSPVVDQKGTLHIVWTESSYGPVLITLMRQRITPYRPKTGRNRSRLIYQRELSTCESIRRAYFTFFMSIERMTLGVYYVRSEDQGATWSEPVWLDPDILPAHTPDSLNFELDENDGLHAVWFYGALEQGDQADWVRYIHSLDGGETWSEPFMIDQYVEESEHNLTVASPIMIVQGQTVHVIWAAGELALSQSPLFNRCRAYLECASTDFWRVTWASI